MGPGLPRLHGLLRESWQTTSSTSRRAKSRRVAEDEGRGSVLRRVSDLQDGGKHLAGGSRRGDIDTEVELVAVNTDEEARRLRFPGSPTIRVGGEDLFPVSEREDWRLGCRVYATPEGLKGSPTAEMLREALTKEAAADATLHR